MYTLIAFTVGLIVSSASFIFCMQKMGRRTREKAEMIEKTHSQRIADLKESQKASDKKYEDQIRELYIQLNASQKTIAEKKRNVKENPIKWGDYNAVCTERESLCSRLQYSEEALANSRKEVEAMIEDWKIVRKQLEETIEERNNALDRVKVLSGLENPRVSCPGPQIESL